MSNNQLIFRQLFDYETYTYTYVLGDSHSREAVIIDSVIENLERDLRVINQLDLKLKYVIDTHTHADHITGAGSLAKRTGAKKVAGKNSGAECADIHLADSDTISFGSLTLKALSTPGHTDGCTSLYTEGMVFTGDTLFIRGNGRTDFQQGSSEILYESITQKLYTLPDETLVYPGHDYKGELHSTIREEKTFNPRISKDTDKEEFVKTMSQLKLAAPKRIHEAVPANLRCGQSI